MKTYTYKSQVTCSQAIEIPHIKKHNGWSRNQPLLSELMFGLKLLLGNVDIEILGGFAAPADELAQRQY